MANQAKTILCFGDSNTHGFDTATMGRFQRNQRYSGLLSTYLDEQYHVVEEGLSGRTNAFDDPFTEGLNAVTLISPILMTHEPVNLLLIMLGTNDTKQRFGATPHNIASGLNRLIIKAKQTTDAWYQSQPNILVICPPPIGDGYAQKIFAGDMGAGCAEKSRALAPLYQEVAERNHCHFLDAGAIPGVKMNTYDYMHLTMDSHQLLAAHLANLIPTIC